MALRLPLLLLAIVLGQGCSPARTPAATFEAKETALPAQPREDLPDEQRSPDLFGAWQVERVTGPNAQPQDSYWNMILLVGNRQLEVLSQCVTIGPFQYGRTSGGGIAVDQVTVTPRPPGSPPLPPVVQCARGLSPAEQALGPLLLAAFAVRPAPDGSVTLGSPAGSLVLRRPTGALANPTGQAPPPRLPPLLGAWRVVGIDGRRLAPSEIMELLLRPRHIEWRSGCVNETRRLERDGDALLPGEVDPFPVCERGRSPAELSFEKLLAGRIAARMASDGNLTLQGSGVTAQLAPLVG